MLPLPTRFAQPIARTCLHSHRPTSRTLVSRHQVCLPLDSVRAFTCIRSYPRPTVRHRPIPSRSQSQFRNCSYRRMCRSRHEDPAGGSVDFAKGREVLPKNVIPRHYDVTLEPNWKDFSFEGSVVIDLDVAEDSTSITLNTVEIDLHSTSVHADGAEITSKPDVSFDEDAQTTTIKFDQTIKAGSKAQLKQTFTGRLNDKMAGFYRSSWKGPNGEKKWIASTQMEATDCRRAFPCWDEPALKAEFTVTLIADKELTCLSNMDVASESEIYSKMIDGKRKAIKFNKSPSMSTYLVAFIVGELESIETNDFRLPIRVFATPDQNIEHGKFSMNLAAKTLAFYEKAFDSKYPLPKMDMVAIPDFSAGAMENWGLITYRVVDVLLDEKTSGAAVKERVAETVQHELAHQWFGNLVTMDFWDGLWLNEGFATWMSWYSCNIFYPEWKIWQSYVINDLQDALSLDSLRSSHPIEVPVKRADEINQIFDSISYAKGSAVLRMISKYIGEDTFIQGIRNYIKKHAYGNTQTGDLWAALSHASGKPVDKVMDIWTKNVGFPVLSVDEDPSAKSIKVTQNRFLATGDVKSDEDKILYPTILGLRTKDGVQDDLMLTQRSDSYSLPDLDFFKLNADHSGIYRTSYTPARLEKLGQAARKGLLTVEDRSGMIADAGALSSAGYQKTSGTLSLFQGLGTETEYVVWNEMIGGIASVRNAWMFEPQTTKDALKAFHRSLVSAKAHELGWEFKESDGHILQQFKTLMFGSAGLSGDQKVITAAQEMFGRYAAGDIAAIHPNLRGSVFGIVLQNGGEKEYDIILKRYMDAPTAEERNTALRSLGRARDAKLIQRTLDLGLSEHVKPQDIYMPLSGLRAHPEGIRARWHWMCKNWELLSNMFPAGLNMLSSILKFGASGFTTREQMKEVKAFFDDKDIKGVNMALSQSLDSINVKANWVERDASDVDAWLKTNGYLEKGKL